MRFPIALLWLWALMLLGACVPSPSEVFFGPSEKQIKAEITQRFDGAYQGLLAISDIELSPAQSELNTQDHRVYDVKLTAVVQQDLQQALDALPEDMENAIARGRIKGIMSLGAVKPGQKITTRLRALVERNPETGEWSVVGLIRAGTPSAKESRHDENEPDHRI